MKGHIDWQSNTRLIALGFILRGHVTSMTGKRTGHSLHLPVGTNFARTLLTELKCKRNICSCSTSASQGGEAKLKVLGSQVRICTANLPIKREHGSRWQRVPKQTLFSATFILPLTYWTRKRTLYLFTQSIFLLFSASASIDERLESLQINLCKSKWNYEQRQRKRRKDVLTGAHTKKEKHSSQCPGEWQAENINQR